MGVDYRIGRPFRHSPFPLGSPGISHHHLARLRKVAARFERDGRHPAPDRACSFASPSVEDHYRQVIHPRARFYLSKQLILLMLI